MKEIQNDGLVKMSTKTETNKEKNMRRATRTAKATRNVEPLANIRPVWITSYDEKRKVFQKWFTKVERIKLSKVVNAGGRVHLKFHFVEGTSGEFLWVRIIHMDTNKAEGVIANCPIIVSIKANDRVVVGLDEAIDLSVE